MNTILLRAARRYPDGSRYWRIPGAPNAAKLLQPGPPWGVPSFHWPHQQPDRTWVMRSVRLDWHRALARQAAQALIQASSKARLTS